MTSLSALRVDLARRSKWNIGYLVAGLVYWSFAAIVGALLPMESAAIWFAMPAHRFSVLPAFVAALYLITFLLLPARRQRWLDVQLRSAAADAR